MINKPLKRPTVLPYNLDELVNSECLGGLTLVISKPPFYFNKIRIKSSSSFNFDSIKSRTVPILTAARIILASPNSVDERPAI